MSNHYTGYLLFCDYMRPMVQREARDQKEMFQILGELWNQQSEDKKQKWNHAAKAITQSSRPWNSYILWGTINGPDLRNGYIQKYGMPPITTALGAYKGEQWKNMSKESKAPWERLSQILRPRVAHQQNTLM
jgi:hypothetical protein